MSALEALRERKRAAERRADKTIIHAMAINQTGEPLRGHQTITAASLELALHAQLDSADKYNLETIPRVTVLKIVETAIDVKFTFRVHKGEAENYMGAMRQVLSRTRKKAKKKHMRLDEFKLLHLGTIEHEAYDEVTLVRTKTLSPYEESVYDSLFNAMKKD